MKSYARIWCRVDHNLRLYHKPGYIDPSTEIEQVAVLVSHPKNRHELAGGKIISVDELMAEIRQEVIARGAVSKNAIPEQYPLLRTLQLSYNGYNKAL